MKAVKRKNRKENEVLVSLIDRLLKEKKPVWKRVAEELSKPRRKRVEVNLSRINQHVNDGETILVPGKVLGAGTLSKKITVAAFSFSESAKKLIGDAGGKAISIDALLDSNPSGKSVVLFK